MPQIYKGYDTKGQAWLTALAKVRSEDEVASEYDRREAAQVRLFEKAVPIREGGIITGFKYDTTDPDEQEIRDKILEKKHLGKGYRQIKAALGTNRWPTKAEVFKKLQDTNVPPTHPGQHDDWEYKPVPGDIEGVSLGGGGGRKTRRRHRKRSHKKKSHRKRSHRKRSHKKSKRHRRR